MAELTIVLLPLREREASIRLRNGLSREVMEIFINILIAVAMLAVVVSLGMGIFSMLKGGPQGGANSNKFMRYRVMSQAVAIVLITIGFIYKARHH